VQVSKRIATYTSRQLAATLMAGLASLAVSAAAQAISPPSAYTGAASDVSFDSATLNGSLNPHGSETSYYFQYGTTTAYGLHTNIPGAGAGTQSTHVTIALGGLAPLTKYHYRLVAVNGDGAGFGVGKTFTTGKVPLSLGILGSPNPVPFGSPLTIQGTLSGTGNANTEVVLQANPFPYTAGFANVGNPELTTAMGGYSFPLLSLSQTTQFRVLTTTKSPTVSPVALESVAVLVSASAGRIGPHHRALFHGTVTPAVDGMQVGLMRVVNGHDVLSGATILRHATAISSSYSVIATAKRGVYRVFVEVTNGSLTSSFSAPFYVH
jgi:hypothetical protein